MFMAGDRVRLRYQARTDKTKGRRHNPEGVVAAVCGRWITVKHDPSDGLVGHRFDYLADELVHLNPLLKLVEAL